MTYRLYLGELDAGIAEDESALNWLSAMHEHGYEDARIESAPGLKPTFPLADDESEQAPDLMRVATVGCPHCQEIVAVPGLDHLFAFVCPHCGESATVTLPIQ